MAKRAQSELYVPPAKKTPLIGPLLGKNTKLIADNQFLRIEVGFDGAVWRYPYVRVVLKHTWSDEYWVRIGNMRANLKSYTEESRRARESDEWAPLATGSIANMVYVPMCEETAGQQVKYARYLASLVRYESFVPSLKAMAMASLSGNPQRSVSLFIDHMTGGASTFIAAEGVAPWPTPDAASSSNAHKPTTQAPRTACAASASSSSSAIDHSLW